MGWFRRESGAAPADPRYTVASVLRADGSTTAGAGVPLTSSHVLTCAHVVNDALGRHLFDSRTPGEALVPVTLHTPVGSYRYAARVAYWVPPRRRDGQPQVRDRQDHEWLGDLAVLVVERQADRAAPPPQWAPMALGRKLRAWHGSGLSSSFADVTVTSFDGVIGYVDGDPTGMAVGPAYSGGPLWSAEEGAVVGVVAAHIMPPADPATGAPRAHSSQHINRRSWCIPWQRVREELLAAGAHELFERPAADPEDPALPLLTEALEAALPGLGGLADTASSVAERCGYAYPRDGSAPGYEEFAELLVTEPRALPALSEVLRHKEPEMTLRLLSVGRLSPVPVLLSPREHRRLRALLDGLPEPVVARLPRAVREALPLAAAFPGWRTVGELLSHLERLSGDSRTDAAGTRVPALLRVTEYAAVLCPRATRANLRLWADAVADRLGIPHSALAERRSDAEDWARAQEERSTPMRVLVQVSTLAGADRYRLRLWCDEGSGPRQVSTDGNAVYSGAAAARELLRTLEALCRADQGEHRPLVEALVDRAGLNLPIDEWETYGPDGLVPAVLGAEYQLVVNCPELLRRNERFLPDWRRRWRQLDTGTSLLITDAGVGPREIYGTLMDRSDAVRVAVDVPAGLRDEIVQVCLAVGVPVVVWDRAEESESGAVTQMSAVTTRELPEGVRSYRAKTVHRPRDYPGRPVLAWADADRTAPQLYLSEPQEGA
ncbi:trypsin-like peptidase domain-containing protein [Streptomyces sp. NPDC085524]|uniref:VMAP-C domain-containing protein n=1 Tax=unclassified Streptomyces TaxID=2593676 RepID=UPI0035E22854